MFKKENLKGADISTEICGIKLQSPYILSSGPLSYAAEGMIKGHQVGCGAVVTKTIRLGAAINPVNHIGKISNDSLINAEKWADSDRLLWYEREIPMTKKAGAVVIGSVGHTLKEAQAIVKDVEKAGADMIELVSYTEDTLIPMLDYTKNNVSIPVICKLSGNWPNAVEVGSKCLEHGADGICAIDSIGPTLKIDINRARPEMFSDDGYGWMTGSAIRPISMRINSEIARNHKGFRGLYGTGGCMNANDAIEFLMAGCSGVGVCSVGILKGVNYIEQMCYDLSAKLAQLGYNSIEEVRGAALPNFPTRELISELVFNYEPFYSEVEAIRLKKTNKCINCKKCTVVCSYSARKLDFPNMTVDMELCRSCGLCVGVCPTGALTSTIAEQTEKHKAMAKASADFYELVK
jgi:dihydropyrimidine dehydrogenase (NAD+) subunit PreA